MSYFIIFFDIHYIVGGGGWVGLYCDRYILIISQSVRTNIFGKRSLLMIYMDKMENWTSIEIAHKPETPSVSIVSVILHVFF